MLAGLVRSATALCEAFTGRVLIARPFVEDIAASGEWQRLALGPVRSIDLIEQAGADGVAVPLGASGYPALGSDGLVDAASGLCAPAREWHCELARCAKLHGLKLIWSLSFELLDMFCPSAWKQRDRAGNSAATGYLPPSTLISPANGAAIAYLGQIAAELVALSVEQGLVPRFQVGEPWWWVAGDGRIHLYDAAAIAAFGGAPVAIDDVGASLNVAQKALLDQAGSALAEQGLDCLGLRPTVRIGAERSRN